MKNYIICLLIALNFIFLYSCTIAPQNDKGKDEKVDPHANHNTLFATGTTYADSVNEGLITSDTLKTSVRRVAMDNIGDCHVHIEYGSPGVRGRNVWGGLVAYDEVWAAGAHSATSVRFSKPVEISDTRIEAGTYAFFAIPGKREWTLILNSRYKQHLTDEYKQDEDLVRINVVPEVITSVPRLTYKVEFTQKHENGAQGSICLLWDTFLVKMPVRVSP